ncbi:acyl-coenzyme A thioesterase THEM4 isoform X4 [Astyanax mexicanus]|uniref:Acyl-coenzyme A thioesterase THEM4 n=1 Tax=Astyanax mexicanus TaxID=7994 RepID=A0A3B1JUK7_ASTMX|nr:acyl-coenzyme A thioesterase THEM4 isoform X4 [Astyanax mexicanus]
MMMMRAGLHAVRAFPSFSRSPSGHSVSGVLQIQGFGTQWKSPSAFQSLRPFSKMSLWPSNIHLQDYSEPNESWSPEMRQLYDQYIALCEVRTDGGEVKTGPWQKLPSYNRTLKHGIVAAQRPKTIDPRARLFTRNVEEKGAAFEYVVFMNDQERRCVCVFQSGHLLEGPPGYVHAGAVATMFSTVTTTLSMLFGRVLTANLNLNFRSPVPLGSVSLIHSAVDKVEGRKIFVTCRMTSIDESKLYTDATALFLSGKLGHVFGTKSV